MVTHMYNNVWTQSLHQLVPHEVVIPFIYGFSILRWFHSQHIVTKATPIHKIALLCFKKYQTYMTCYTGSM